MTNTDAEAHVVNGKKMELVESKKASTLAAVPSRDLPGLFQGSSRHLPGRTVLARTIRPRLSWSSSVGARSSDFTAQLPSSRSSVSSSENLVRAANAVTRRVQEQTVKGVFRRPKKKSPDLKDKIVTAQPLRLGVRNAHLQLQKPQHAAGTHQNHAF